MKKEKAEAQQETLPQQQQPGQQQQQHQTWHHTKNDGFPNKQIVHPQQQQAVFCPNCGKPRNPHYRFCPFCGYGV